MINIRKRKLVQSRAIAAMIVNYDGRRYGINLNPSAITIKFLQKYFDIKQRFNSEFAPRMKYKNV